MPLLYPSLVGWPISGCQSCPCTQQLEGTFWNAHPQHLLLKTLQQVLSLNAFLWPLQPSVGVPPARLVSVGMEAALSSSSIHPVPIPAPVGLGSEVISPRERPSEIPTGRLVWVGAGGLQNRAVRAASTAEGRCGGRANSQPPAEVLSGSSCVPPDSWHGGVGGPPPAVRSCP